jgi:oligopeptide/dipeptide ABC transporter ATP-binding protein
VADIVGEPLRLHGMGTRETRADRVNELLDQVGIATDVGRRYPHELSGGQRQRVSLARALSAGPSLLVADEPTSALDVSVQAAVLNLIGRLQRDLGFACLFITHDLASVEFLAQRIAVMYLGVLVEVASREDLFAAPRHPYTQALLSAAPIPDPLLQRTRSRIVLSGEVPSPVDPPSGCRFHPRCPVAVPECARVVPPLRPVGPRGDLVACHLVSDDGSGPRLA